MKNFTDQEIDTAFRGAPEIIRNLITSGEEIVPVITGLGSELKLHVDQLTKIATLNRNMLIGLISPQEFLGELKGAGISDTDAQKIIGEINEKIFVPVHEKMHAGRNAVPKVLSTPPVQPSTQIQPPTAAPPPSAPRPVTQVAPASSAPVVMPIPSTSIENLLHAPLPPKTIMPGPTSSNIQTPKTALIPQNLPGTTPEPNLSSINKLEGRTIPPPVFAPQPPRPIQPQPPKAPPQPYASDPYHEPIEP